MPIKLKTHGQTPWICLPASMVEGASPRNKGKLE